MSLKTLTKEMKNVKATEIEMNKLKRSFAVQIEDLQEALSASIAG